jgi:hypothetical protein
MDLVGVGAAAEGDEDGGVSDHHAEALGLLEPM